MIDISLSIFSSILAVRSVNFDLTTLHNCNRRPGNRRQKLRGSSQTNSMSTLQIPNTSRYRDRSSSVSSSSSADSDTPSSPDSESCHEASVLKVPQRVSPKRVQLWSMMARSGGTGSVDSESHGGSSSTRRLMSDHAGSMSSSNKDLKSMHIDKLKGRHNGTLQGFKDHTCVRGLIS